MTGLGDSPMFKLEFKCILLGVDVLDRCLLCFKGNLGVAGFVNWGHYWILVVLSVN